MGNFRTRRRITAVGMSITAVVSLALVATPAKADPTPFTAENFNPDGSGSPAGSLANATNDTVVSVLSDKADGGNSTFHVTTVTSQNAELVQWYICPTFFPNASVDPGADPAGEDPTLPANSCTTTPVGQDTTGTVPPSLTGAALTAAGKAFDAEVDFIVSGDPAARDLVAWVCAATPATDANCDAEVEPSIQMDDGSTTPASASSAGEITLPSHPGTLSNQGFSATARTSPDVTGVTFCLAALDETAGTEADETGDPTECITDSDFGGGGMVGTIKTDIAPDNPAAQQATFKTWSAAWTAAETPDNQEMALVLIEGTDTDGDMIGGMPAAASGSGVCAGGGTDCQLDSHYVVSAPPIPTSVKIAFPDEGTVATLPNNCTETEALSGAESQPEQYNRVQGCIFDQSGNNVTDTQHWAFQITPPDTANTATDETGFECQSPQPPKACSDSSFPDDSNNSGEHRVTFGAGPAAVGWPNYECNGREASPGAPVDPLGDPCPTGPPGADGVQNDLNNDRFYEQADGDPGQTAGGTAGVADEVLDFHTGGSYTVTFCVDANNDAATSATPCANEAISTNGTQTVQPIVDHVHVKRQESTDAVCHTGDPNFTAPEASVVNLRGCAITKPATTEQPAPAIHVLWILNPAGAAGATGSIVGQTNITNPSGHATAQISSGVDAAGKSTTIRFCQDTFPESATAGGQDGDGTCDAAQASSGAELDTQVDFKIDWTAIDKDRLCDPLRDGAAKDELLIGGNGKDRLCGFGGDDTLRGLGGNDSLKSGTGDDSNSGGRGNDAVRGGPGADKMKGGAGDDSLKGGGGDDTARGGGGSDSCKAEAEQACER